LLDRALEQQRRLLQLAPSPDRASGLERLGVARDDERAQAAVRQVDALEAAAAAARQSGRADVAREKIREAMRLQREVDDSRATDRFKNYAREMALAQAVRNAEAEPVARELEAALGDARAAVADRRWSDAASAYAKARTRRAELARDHGRTQFANETGLRQIDAEIAAFAPAFAAAEVGEDEQRADAAAKAGRVQDAAALYAAARDAQIRLNAKFAASRFASPQRVEELEVTRQTLLAAGALARAQALDAAAAAHLFKRETFAAGRDVGEAAALLESVEKDFPQARGFDGALKIKLAYLRVRGAELGALQDSVYDGLVPVAGFKDVLMLGAAVPRELYARVMSANAGRGGDARGVDSVNWNDAREFCRRLSWVLGVRSRLPTAAEYRAARASEAIAPTGSARKEWLATDDDENPAAPVAAANESDPRTMQRLDRETRARDVSFRFVVEYPLE
ncbi:MAG TPA: hypothetical protein VG710_09415, partial [Opitutus sp.]|nr:hypothetical protein [Opitutus sp.]